MAPRKPGTPALGSHPALAFGKAGAELPADGDVPVTELIRGNGTPQATIAQASSDYADLMTAPDAADSLDSTATTTAGDPRDEFMADVVAIFESNSTTTPEADVPPPDDADADDTDADEPDAPERKPSDDAVDTTPATTATTPAPATPAPTQDPGERLVEWFSSLSPTQIAAIERAVADPGTVLGSAPSMPATAPTPTPAPAAPMVPEFDYSLMDPDTAAIVRAQQAQIDHLRTLYVADMESRQAATARTVEQRVIAARDQWAADNNIDVPTLARLEAMPETHALLAKFAQGTDDYESVTRKVLDSAVWLDPEIRASRMQVVAQQHVDTNTADLARVRERKTRAAQVQASGGSAPRIESTDTRKMSKDQRADAAVEFLSERMSG